ncbi:MAG: rhomboid family intramembrane serine protease [Candidatus Pacearchaeota archaeon]|jgi:membrane associated rhomboid family serine protease
MDPYYSVSTRKRSILNYFSMTSIIIFVNVLAFIVFTALIALNVLPISAIAITPINILHGKDLWTFITSMFMHAGIEHLFFNMFSLFFIGTFLERVIGRKRYFWFYMIAGIIAGAVFVLLSSLFGTTMLGAQLVGAPDVAGVGASGAIFGLLGVLAVLVPYAKVFLILGPLIAIILGFIVSPLLSSSLSTFIIFILNVYILISIFAIFSFNPRIRRLAIPVKMSFWLLPIVALVPLIILGLIFPLPIANTAHLGGLLAGLVYGTYLRNKYKRKTKYLSRYFS